MLLNPYKEITERGMLLNSYKESTDKGHVA